MVEAQLGDEARYSHNANSAFGVAFDVLGLPPNVERKTDWLLRFIQAPFLSMRKAPRIKLYVVETDCDRPREGQMLAEFLKPEVTLWVSVFRTHSMNFDKLVTSGAFPTHEAAIAHQFAYFARQTTRLVIANTGQTAIKKELDKLTSGVTVKGVSQDAVKTYRLETDKTIYEINGQRWSLPGIHPKDIGISIQLVAALLDYLHVPADTNYTKLVMPPGRSNVLRGKKNLTIIDSTYNTGLGAMTAIINLFAAYPASQKWWVLGDILEQGSVEMEEHEKLAEVLADVHPEHVVLLGPRTQRSTLPKLKQLLPEADIASFLNAKEVLDYLEKQLSGGEAVLFKGARGLEGVIEQLLEDPGDEKHLVRRGAAWQKRRQTWGLPK